MSAQLQLVSIRAKNFGRHQDLEAVFSDHLTVIKGPNGAGKSTFLQAIYFAFFGVSAVDGKAADIPFTGEKDCSVTLAFRIGVNSYTIVRTLKNATLQDADEIKEIIATGHTSVNQWVEKHLGVSQKLFLMLTYSPQTETAAIMSIGAAQLNRMVEEIAEADFISRVEKTSSDLQLEADIGLRHIERPQDVGELTVRETVAQVAAVTATTNFTLADEAATAAKMALREFKPVIAKARVDAATAKELHTALPELERTMGAYEAGVERALSDIAKVTVTAADLDTAKQAHLATYKQLQEAEDGQEKHAIWIDRVTRTESYIAQRKPQAEQIAKLERPLCDASALVALRRREMDTAQGLRNDATTRLAKAKETVDNASCPTCLRPFDEAALSAANSAVITIALEVVKLNTDFTNCRSAYLEAEAAYKNLDGQMPANPVALQQSIKDKEAELVELRSNEPTHTGPEVMAQLRTLYDEQTVRVRSIKTDLSLLEDYEKHHKDFSARLEICKGKKATLEKQIAELGDVDLTSLQTKETELTQRAGETELALNNATVAKNSATLMVDALKKEIVKAERLMLERTSLERRKSSFSGLTKYLRDNRETFMAEMWTQLMALTSQFVSGVTDGRISAILRGDGSDFYYVEDGIEKPYARLAGGFKAVAGVGLRVALASLLPAGVSLVVLDEPSSELRDDLAASLAGALRATDRQIVLVTHREGEEFASDQVIELSL